MFYKSLSKLFLLLVCSLILLGSPTSTEARPIPTPEKPESPLALLQQRWQERTPSPQNLQPAAFTPCVDGIADTGAQQYPCNHINLMSFLPLSAIGGGDGNDIWGWTDPVTGREYAIMGRTNGTAFVDVTDPVNPVYIGNLATHTSNSIWRDMKVYNDYAFIVSEAGGHGIQIFDLTELRDVTVTPVTFSETAHFSGFSNAHNIVMNEDSGFAYGVGTNTCSGGLHMVDVRDPLNPLDAGCFSADGYTHDAQCVMYHGPDADYAGHEICFNSNTDTLTIADVTVKTAPVQVSRTGYSGTEYTHQGWLTEDHTYFLLNDELDELNLGHNTRTRIFDVSNLDAPVLIGVHDGTTPATDHNLYVRDGLAYESNYSSGLRVLDAIDVASGSLDEVAFFDTYPIHNSAGFDGAWSSYPYFGSGTIVVSGIDEGLFVLQLDLDPSFFVGAESDELNICNDGTDSVPLSLVDQNGYAGSVALSTLGLPATLSSDFSVNPVTVPGSSLLTVTNSGTSAGAYSFSVMGTDGVLEESRAMSLHIYDMIPPAVALTQPADTGINIFISPVFEWQAVSQAHGYQLEIATDAGMSDVVYSALVEDTRHILPMPLLSATTYYWRVTAQNACGMGTPSPIYSFTTVDFTGACTAGIEPTMVYDNNFDGIVIGWTHSGLQDTWALSNAQSNSGLQSWHAADPNARSDQRLVSPLMVLPDSVEAGLTLRFQSRQGFEAPDSDGCWDAGILEVSFDGGTTWEYVPPEKMITDPYDDKIWDDTLNNNPIRADYNELSEVWGWCSVDQPFINSIVDIAGYAGQSVQFAWRLGSDNNVGGTHGWYVDDVKVQSCDPLVVTSDTTVHQTPTNPDSTTIVEYEVDVINKNGIADSFTVEASGSWVATPSITTTPLLNTGESTTVVIAVEIPAGTFGGESDTTLVTVTSNSDSTIMEQVSLTTVVAYKKLFLPIMMK